MIKIITDEKRIDELLTTGVAEVVVKNDLKKKLLSGKKLRVKHGVDPTTKDLHLGYGVVYHKLREFQELGHQVIFLIGGFTGRFGDPADKEKARDLRAKKEVLGLAKNYLQQLGKILDISKVEIRDNSNWYDKWSFEQGLKLLSKFTVARMLERDMFQKRQAQNKEIYYHEPVYPMLQGWDSVELKSDVTVIGLDQKFNELQARNLQTDNNQAPQDIVAVPLLLGTDGKMKMSQSLGNSIGLADPAAEQFGKIMSIPDELLLSYFELVARYKQTDLKRVKTELSSGRNPRDLKIELAKAVVTMYHSESKAESAAKNFISVFSHKQIPLDVPEIVLKNKKYNWPDFLTDNKLCPSKSEARRLLSQGAVKLNGEKITNLYDLVEFKTNDLIQIGKKTFVKIK